MRRAASAVASATSGSGAGDDAWAVGARRAGAPARTGDDVDLGTTTVARADVGSAPAGGLPQPTTTEAIPAATSVQISGPRVRESGGRSAR